MQIKTETRGSEAALSAFMSPAGADLETPEEAELQEAELQQSVMATKPPPA